MQLNLSITTTFTIQSIACSSCGNEDWWYVSVRATTLCLLELIQVAIWMSSKRRSSMLSADRHRQVLLCTFITLMAFDGRRGFLWRIMLGWRCLCLRSTCDGLYMANIVRVMATDVSTSFWIIIIYRNVKWYICFIDKHRRTLFKI